jgi:steroid 5-alpha reductase family enzyme
MSLFATFLVLALAIWAYMTLWFVIARLFQRTDLVDSAWGLGFIYIAWLAWLMNGRSIGIKLAAAEFVTLWGLRLFVHIFHRNVGKHEDYRYVAYREKWGDKFWLTAYTRIFLTQGVLLLAISTTTIAIMTATKSSWHGLLILGFIVWALGIIIEAEADAELTKFVKHKKPGQIMTKGLWHYSRHPNYFGEITTWWGAAIVAISVQQWWGIIGALLITFLITKVSGIPPLEKHYADNVAFQKYKKHTSILIPLPVRKAK